MSRIDPNWKYHKDDPTWPYDKYGFAKGGHVNGTAWSFIDAINRMDNPDPVEIEDDYTAEFLEYYTPPKLMEVSVECQENPNNRSLMLYLYTNTLDPYAVEISRLTIRNGTDFKKNRLSAYRIFAAFISRHVESQP